MTTEILRHNGESGETDWISLIEDNIDNHIIAGRGIVHDGTITYSVLNGDDPEPVEITLESKRVAEMMRKKLNLIPLVSQKQAHITNWRPEFGPSHRQITRVDRRRAFLAALPRAIAIEPDTQKAVGLAMSVAGRQTNQGNTLSLNPRLSLIREERTRAQAAVVFILDESISEAYQPMVSSLMKYTKIWLGAGYEHVEFNTAYYGRSANSENKPNSADGYRLAEDIMRRTAPQGEWNRYLFHISSANDDPQDRYNYQETIRSVAEAMDFTGIIPVGSYSGYSTMFRETVVAYYNNPIPNPRVSAIYNPHSLPATFTNLFGEIKAKNSNK